MFPIFFQVGCYLADPFDREIQHQIASLNLPTWISDVCCNKNPAPFFLKVIWQHCWLFLSQLSHLKVLRLGTLWWPLSSEWSKKFPCWRVPIWSNAWTWIIKNCEFDHVPGIFNMSYPLWILVPIQIQDPKVEKSLDHHRLVSWTDKAASENIFGFTMVSLQHLGTGHNFSTPSTVTADSDRFPPGGPFPTTGGEAFQHSPETRLISLQPSTSRSMVSRTSRYPQLLKPTAGGWESTFPPPSPSQKKTNKYGDVYPGSLWWFNTNFLCLFLLNRNQWTCLIQDLDWATNCLEGKCKVSSLDPLLVDFLPKICTL